MTIARVKVLVSFNGMYAGDEAEVDLTPQIEGWISVGMMEVVCDGAHPAGPGSTEPDAEDGAALKGGSGSTSGDEPGEGARPRRHRKTPVLDQDREALIPGVPGEVDDRF